MKNSPIPGNENSLPLFRLIIPRTPFPTVFSHILMAPLGALYVATAISEGGKWDVEVIDESNWQSHVSRRALALDETAEHAELQKRRPANAVGFYGGLTSTVPRLFKLAGFYKSLGIPTIAGGAHVDALPEEALNENIDLVVHGEGEETIGEILNAWSSGSSLSEIKGISFKNSAGEIITTERRKPICNLDDLPVPDFKLQVDLKHPLTLAPIERTRGCNFNCEFCIVNKRFGPTRSSSPEKFAAEIEQRVDEGFTFFFCVDDNFTEGRKNTLKMLKLVADIKKRKAPKLNITVQVRSAIARDEELLLALRAAGVQVLCIGLESPIAEELKAMSKHQTPEEIENDVRTIRKYGFMIHGMFIFGYPLENSEFTHQLSLRERADCYISFIKRNGIDTIQILKPVPIPGSRLAKRLMEQGRIMPLNEVGWDKYDGNFLTFIPEKGISASELQEQATRIMQKFYSPFSFLKFPLLVFDTPIRILRLGFRNANQFAQDPAACTRTTIMGGVEKVSALRAGFIDARHEIARRWRNAFMRTLGSHTFSSWYRASHHRQFLKLINRLQSAKATVKD